MLPTTPTGHERAHRDAAARTTHLPAAGGVSPQSSRARRHRVRARPGRGATRDKVALHWEGEPGDTRRITYGELHAEVNRCANALKQLGVARGDRVAIYMPMVPEVAVAMLACARIGAPHTVVFGGFSAARLR